MRGPPSRQYLAELGQYLAELFGGIFEQLSKP
jgi:hypothetical protein